MPHCEVVVSPTWGWQFLRLHHYIFPRVFRPGAETHHFTSPFIPRLVPYVGGRLLYAPGAGYLEQGTFSSPFSRGWSRIPWLAPVAVCSAKWNGYSFDLGTLRSSYGLKERAESGNTELALVDNTMLPVLWVAAPVPTRAMGQHSSCSCKGLTPLKQLVWSAHSYSPSLPTTIPL